MSTHAFIHSCIRHWGFLNCWFSSSQDCCSVMLCVAVCCSVWHCDAVCCSVLRCEAVVAPNRLPTLLVLFLKRLLQRVAACCSVLQRVAACRSVLQRDALHRVAACCSALQRVKKCVYVDTTHATMISCVTDVCTSRVLGVVWCIPGWIHVRHITKIDLCVTRIVHD